LVIGQFASSPVAQALTGLAFAAPFILLMWLVRRAFYVNGQPQWSASGGLGYLVLMLVGIFELHQQQWLSVALALATMGIAGLVVSLWLAAVLRRRGPAGGPQLTASSVFVDHWEYGKWAAATTALSWVPGGISYLLLPAWGGLEGSAALRAVMNLIMPMVHAFSAVSVLLLPFFVKGLKVEGLTWLYRWVRSSCICLAVISLCSWGVLLVFHKELMLWLYGGRYLNRST
jgi:O-antigen/teichoic acid export membrane protein